MTFYLIHLIQMNVELIYVNEDHHIKMNSFSCNLGVTLSTTHVFLLSQAILLLEIACFFLAGSSNRLSFSAFSYEKGHFPESGVATIIFQMTAWVWLHTVCLFFRVLAARQSQFVFCGVKYTTQQRTINEHEQVWFWNEKSTPRWISHTFVV